MEHQLDMDYMGAGIKYYTHTLSSHWTDDEQGIVLEIELYLNDRKSIESTAVYIDPLAYWFDKRSSLP